MSQDWEELTIAEQERLREEQLAGPRVLTWCMIGLLCWLLIGTVAFRLHEGPTAELERQAALVAALDAYCGPVEYRDDICQVTLPQGFGEVRRR